MHASNKQKTAAASFLQPAISHMCEVKATIGKMWGTCSTSVNKQQIVCPDPVWKLVNTLKSFMTLDTFRFKIAWHFNDFTVCHTKPYYFHSYYYYYYYLFIYFCYYVSLSFIYVFIIFHYLSLFYIILSYCSLVFTILYYLNYFSYFSLNKYCSLFVILKSPPDHPGTQKLLARYPSPTKVMYVCMCMYIYIYI